MMKQFHNPPDKRALSVTVLRAVGSPDVRTSNRRRNRGETPDLSHDTECADDVVDCEKQRITAPNYQNWKSTANPFAADLEALAAAQPARADAGREDDAVG